MSKLTIVKDVLDQCSQTELTNIFSPITDLPSTSSKAE